MQSDNAKQFISMRKVLKGRGIKLNMIFSHTLESNGVAKQMNRTLLERVRALVKEAGVPH